MVPPSAMSANVVPVSPWPIGCTILVHMTHVTPAAGKTEGGNATETATRGGGTDMMITGTMTDVTIEIDGPGTTRGGFDVFFES